MLIRPVEFSGYHEDTVQEESEMMNFDMTQEKSKVFKGVISLNRYFKPWYPKRTW